MMLQLSFLPVEQQSQYADVVCVENASDFEFADDQSECDYTTFKRWNVGSLGNASYMSLHAPTTELRARYEAHRQRYIQWLHRRFWTATATGLACLAAGMWYVVWTTVRAEN